MTARPLRRCGQRPCMACKCCYAHNSDRAVGDVQEELRLAHVAVTRARDRLFLTSHRVMEFSLYPVTAANLAASINSAPNSAVYRAPLAVPYFANQIPLPWSEAQVLSRTRHPQSTGEQLLVDNHMDAHQAALYRRAYEPGVLPSCHAACNMPHVPYIAGAACILLRVHACQRHSMNQTARLLLAA
jgi:hypothetical protein